MAVEYIGNGAPDGTCIGLTASELVSFHAASPVNQYAAITTLALTTVLSSGFGFQTSAGAVAAIAALNSILDCLKEKGLIA